MPHTQYHPQSVPLPELQDNDDDEEQQQQELHDGLVPPGIEEDPEHDRLIDPED